MNDATRPAATTRRWPWFVAVASLATLPYLSLLAGNVGQGIDLAAVATWWVATLAVGIALLAATARWRPQHTAGAAVVIGVALYLCFNYPLVTGLQPEGIGVSAVVWWALVAAGVLVVAVLLSRHTAVQGFVAVVAPLLLLGPMVQFATTEAPPTPSAVTSDTLALTHTPDVYWFVLDGLAGVDWLRDEGGVATDPFVTTLEDAGFDVLDGAHSNYPLTHLAVASALELELLYDGVDEPPPAPFFESLQGDNTTVDTFLANDYGYVHAYPGLWTGSRCGGREDVCLGDHGPLDDTSAALLATTPLDALVDPGTHSSIAEANDPAAVIDRVLDEAPPGPTFAFVHLLSPHPPYLRDAECGLREVPLRFAAWGDGPEYRDAVTCLFHQLEQAVEQLLADGGDPVIVISGDHGPRLGLSDETRGTRVLDEEMHLSAFSAIRLPEPCADREIPEDLTFVNTFRVVFACLADQPLDLVEDRLFSIRRDYG